MSDVAKLIIKVQADVANARRGLDRMQARIERLSRMSPSVRVDVDTGRTRAELANLSRRLDTATRDRTVNVRVDNHQGIRALNKFSNVALIMGSIVTGVSAAMPLLVAASGAIAGVAVAAGAAGGALGIFGAAFMGAANQVIGANSPLSKANTYLKSTQATLSGLTPGTKAYATAQQNVNRALQRYNSAVAALNPAQQAFLGGIDSIKAKWKDFISATSGATLRPAATALHAMADHMMQLVPLVKAVSPIVQGVANAFARWTKNNLPGWINFLSTVGVSALHTFVNILRDGLTVVGAFAKAFAFFGLGLVANIKMGADQLARWAQGGGFSGFVDKVRAVGPAVSAFFKEFFTTIGHLAQAFANLGPVSLLSLTGILHLINALPMPVLTALVAILGPMALGIGLVTKAIVIWKNVQKILDLELWSCPVFWLVAALVVLGAAIFLIATKTTWFQTAWKYTWNAVKATGVAIWNGIKTAFSAVMNFLHGKWGWLIAFIGPVGWLIAIAMHWRAIWGGIKAVASAVWGAIRNAWHATTNAISSALGSMGSHIKSYWTSLWNSVRGIASSAWNGLKAGARAFGNAFVSAFDHIKNGVNAAWSKLKSIFKAPISFVVNTVFNHGLVPLWNNTAAKLPGIGKMKPMQKFATGGHVRGSGTGTSDSIPAMLSHGEYVIKASAAKQIGIGNLNALNNGQGGPSGTRQGVPGYKGGGGIGGFIGGIGHKIAGAAKGAWSLVKSGANFVKQIGTGLAAKAFGAAWDHSVTPLANKIPGAGPLPTGLRHAPTGWRNEAMKFIKGKDDAAKASGGGSGSPYKGGGNLAKWIAAALAITHTPASWGGPLGTLVMRESGGNPNAINNWDSNAKAGHPSKGLAQTIPSTFSHYHQAGTSSNIFDPVANLAASLNYIKAVYGSIFKVQQASGKTPKGYALGGLARGVSIVGERGPELINAGSASRVTSNRDTQSLFASAGGGKGGDTYNITIQVTGASVTDARAIEDLVVKGVTSAQRKGRLKK